MPIFSSGKSWTNQAKNTGNPSNSSGSNRGGPFGSRSWSSTVNAKQKGYRCPPINDCRVKQSLMASAREQRLWGVKTKKEVRAAKRAAAKVAKQQKAERARGRSGGGGWPFAGSYDPNREKGRGRGR